MKLPTKKEREQLEQQEDAMFDAADQPVEQLEQDAGAVEPAPGHPSFELVDDIESRPAAPAGDTDDEKRRLVAAYLRGQQAAGATRIAPRSPTPPARRSMGGLIVVGVAVLLVLVGFAILMWRMSRTESVILQQVAKI